MGAYRAPPGVRPEGRRPAARPRSGRSGPVGRATADEERNGIGRRRRRPRADRTALRRRPRRGSGRRAVGLRGLYRDLSPAVTGYLRLHGAVEPDDLASETFIGVFTGLSGFSGDEDALRAWVFTIAHRRLVDDWRRRSRRPQMSDDPGDLTELAAATSRTTTGPGGDREGPRALRVAARRPADGDAPADPRRPHGRAGRRDMGRSVGSTRRCSAADCGRCAAARELRRKNRCRRAPLCVRRGDDRSEMTTPADDPPSRRPSRPSSRAGSSRRRRRAPRRCRRLRRARCARARPSRVGQRRARRTAGQGSSHRPVEPVRPDGRIGRDLAVAQGPDRERRFAMFFPALLAKLLSAGAVAQAATGAGIVLVAFTGAGAAGLLGTGPGHDHCRGRRGLRRGRDGRRHAVSGAARRPATADPATVDGTQGQTTGRWSRRRRPRGVGGRRPWPTSRRSASGSA